MSAPVFLAESAALAALAPGSTYRLDGPEGRHAGVVQRRRAGERIDVVDGAGTRLLCTVATVDRDVVELTVEEIEHAAEPVPRLVLVQALAKGDRDELAIEAATELGADGFIPWQAQRSVVVWRGERAAKSRARWLATVRSAVKQSRRSRIPQVEVAVDSAALARRIAQTCADGGAVLVLHEEATTTLHAVALPEASVTPDGRVPAVLVVVGPEGGIADAEVDAFTTAGAQLVRLGPHVLRTSTAGPVALALLADRFGRWA
ncbi:MAG: 16S rRNA (uracil(1498)-N(3))-methyltransferase [Cellulomonadaceae bacterium]